MFYSGEMKSSSKNVDTLLVRPLGAGQEVGRSCIYLEFMGKKVLFDCGVHPKKSGVESLPFLDVIDVDQIDLLLVTHFHIDHCGAVPWLLQKTTFKGKCYMTHPTKSVFPIVLADYIRIQARAGDALYSQNDLEASFGKIKTMNFYDNRTVNGIKFWAYNAGHVLGAAMFMIEINGVRLLYTGDYNRIENRHLVAADIPPDKPDVIIIESTYGIMTLEDRTTCEHRFIDQVRMILNRGGRCLIPIFALGPIQEILIILEHYWDKNPDLQNIPIYYSSVLAKQCLHIYKHYSNDMNQTFRKRMGINNPFAFKYVTRVETLKQFQDDGACVYLASPGMLQNGISRKLFEMWCSNKRNGVIIPGYCCDGTLAKNILCEPEHIQTLTGRDAPLRMSIDHISFSNHADFNQTSEFLRILNSPHVILVHGESHEMFRLQRELIRKFSTKMQVYSPANAETVSITLYR